MPVHRRTVRTMGVGPSRWFRRSLAALCVVIPAVYNLSSISSLSPVSVLVPETPATAPALALAPAPASVVIPVVNDLSSISRSLRAPVSVQATPTPTPTPIPGLQDVRRHWESGRPGPLPGQEQQPRPIVRRMLFGIFTHDKPNEHEIRQINRAAMWRVFKNRAARGGGSLGDDDDEKIMDALTANNTNENVVCTLSELMGNETLAGSAVSCRFVFTFVMGGGDAGSQEMRTKLTQKANDFNARDDAKKNETRDFINLRMKPKTRCLYGDPDCGGTDPGKWVIPGPVAGSNASALWRSELDRHRGDTTILAIPENHQLGKTDTWYTYASMLARSRPDLGIDFVGKMDGDNSMRFHAFARFLVENRAVIDASPYVHGGRAVPKKQCARQSWGRVCAGSEFIAPLFVTGGISYLSTPLAQSVYLDGTTLERKREIWIGLEDLQVSNMAYSNPKIDPSEILVLNHRGRSPQTALGLLRPKPDITEHCYNDPSCLRSKYCSAYPGLFPELCVVVHVV